MKQTTVTFHERAYEHGISYPDYKLLLDHPYKVKNVWECEHKCSLYPGRCSGLMIDINIPLLLVCGVDINERAVWGKEKCV